jgi:hypothetical protein
MGNKRINKAYVRYDGTGRVIPGSLILNRFKPKVGNWQETPAYLCCNEAPILALRLLFSNISEVDAIVGDSSNVADWNTYFDLPTYGSPFTSVEVVGDEVRLFGGSNIIIKEMLFDQNDYLGTFLLEVDDAAGCVIELEYDAFGQDNFNGCTNLTSVSFPSVTTIGMYVFNFTNLSSINLSSCTNLGGTVGDDFVFSNINGNTITLTVPSALMTINSGSPDGDIQDLQANNTVTVVTV